MKIPPWVTIAAISVVFVVLSYFIAPGLERWERLSADARQAFRYGINDLLGRAAGADQKGLRRGAGTVGRRTELAADDICLIAIDDATLRYFGKWGTGLWTVREPFRRLAEHLQRDFPPSVVAFDILFRPPEGSAVAQRGAADITHSIEALRSLEQDAGADIEGGVLFALTRIAAEQADTKLATYFAELRDPSDSDRRRVGVILACDFAGTDGASSGTWSKADILGADPNNLSEDNGETVPYLRDIAIPADHVRNAPIDYLFLSYAVLPSPALRDYSQQAFINVPRDDDGMIRRVPLVLGFRYGFADPASGQNVVRRVFVPSYTLLSILNHWGLKPDAVEVDFGRELRIRRADGHLTRVPIDGQGRLFLNFTGRLRDYHRVSMVGLIQAGQFLQDERDSARVLDEADRQTIAYQREHIPGRIAMVGLTATATTDTGPCPVDPNTPFVFVHMTAASNILSGQFLAPAGPGLLLAILAGLFVGYTWFCCRAHVLRLTLGTVALVLAYLVASYLLVHFNLTVIPLVAPMFYAGTTYCTVLVYRFLTEERARKKVRSMFSTMVSPTVLQYMEEHPESFSLGGIRADATMMFSDVAGFTSISEKLSPAELVELLNQYLSAMTNIILGYNGYVDKYEGDAIMAVWGVPYPDPRHAVSGCLASLDQQVELARIRARLQERFGVPVHIRLGLNSGSVIAGNMGSDRKFQYTVMGDTVNQAARFEPANKDYGTKIMVGESTCILARDAIEVRQLDRLVVTGKTEPAAIFELIGRHGEIDEPTRRFVECYESALKWHWERRWDEALAKLDEGAAVRPDDKSLTTLRERIEGYRVTPPPPEWRGEFVRRHKD